MMLDPEPFKTLIRNLCGLTFDANNEGNLLRALEERIRTHGINPGEYLLRLRANAREFQELVNRLTINETFFFREPEQLRLVVEKIVPRTLQLRQGMGPVRILSAGCSSGEEPYSLVMALMERYGSGLGALFSFHGCDIDSMVLAKARRGCYSEFSFRGVDDSWKHHYFHRDKGHYCLKESVKRAVTFHAFNLLSDPIIPEFREIDILLFRNVSIYFDLPTRQRVLERVASMLSDHGILIVAASETLANDLGGLRLVQEDGLFHFTKADMAAAGSAKEISRRPASDDRVVMPDPHFTVGLAQGVPQVGGEGVLPPSCTFTLSNGSARETIPTPCQEEATVADGGLDQARLLLSDKRYDEALARLDALLVNHPNHVGATLLKAHLLIERREFDVAEQLSRLALSADPGSIDAIWLLGVVAKWRKRRDEAIDWFKQAVYREHLCWPAHYYLADLYRAGHETERARRAYRVVMHLLSTPRPESGLRHLPVELPVAEIRFLCAHQLEKLDTTPTVLSTR
ncbi:MAG: hypothetical protein H7834_04160 [Magnetococcus sp. YQC-9]